MGLINSLHYTSLVGSAKVDVCESNSNLFGFNPIAMLKTTRDVDGCYDVMLAT